MGLFRPARMADGRRVQVKAVSLVVNAHVGLPESPLMIKANPEIVFVNSRTNLEVRCGVIRVNRLPAGALTLAFEFHEPTAQFWPIGFPPEDRISTTS